MTTQIIKLPSHEVDVLEDVTTRAKGSIMKQYGKRYLKGIMLHDQMIAHADRDMKGLTEFRQIVDKVCAAGNMYTSEKNFVYTVELSDQRLVEKGMWHTDTNDHDSWLNLMVPLDDITPENGGTVIHNTNGSHTYLYGNRGEVYAFKGCTRHCVEGNRSRSPRRLLIIVIRPIQFLYTPNVNVETYRRIMTSQSKDRQCKLKKVHVAHSMRTRSKS